MTPAKRDSTGVPGVLSADEVYTLHELQRRLRLGRHALRAMRRRGLRVHRVANRGFVVGRDFLDFVARQPADGEHATDDGTTPGT